MRRTFLLLAVALLASALPGSTAGAQESQACPPDDGQALFPGECRTYGYEITNPNSIDGTFFTRIEALVVRDQNDNVVGAAERDAFLNNYFTVSWDKSYWTSIPDPGDANRTQAQSTGGIDLLVQPVPRLFCGPRPITDTSACRLGRIHRAGSRSLAQQRTDQRVALLVIKFSIEAAGSPQSGWYLSAWTIRITAAVPAQSDCPSPTIVNVCPVPVYER